MYFFFIRHTVFVRRTMADNRSFADTLRHSFPLFCMAARGEHFSLQQSLAPLESIDKMAHVFICSARHPTCAMKHCIVIRYSATVVCMNKDGGEGSSCYFAPKLRPKKKKKKLSSKLTHTTQPGRERDAGHHTRPRTLKKWYANIREGW